MTMNRVTIGAGKDNWEKDTLPKEQEDMYIANEEQRAIDKTNFENLKASAKTKLMAGEPLTEEEADVMIGG